jgi:STE24 endopeptidase
VNEDRASRYHRLQRRAAVVSVLVQAALILALVPGGASRLLRDVAVGVTGASSSSPSTVLLFVVMLFLSLELAALPTRFYQTFVLEWRYGLSSAPLRVWAVDHLKSAAINLIVAIAAAEAAYFTLARWPNWWWVPSAAMLILAVVVVARLTPVVLLPVFYRFKPLERSALRARLVSLSARAGMPVLGVYEWGLGDKTRRANAALVGTGRTRRILVSDTLLAEYTDDEIEVILAHELGHHAHGDIRRGLVIESGRVLATCAIAAVLLRSLWPQLHLEGPADVAGLPLLLLAASGVLFTTGPLVNAWSRRNERHADHFALTMTARPDAFVSAMRRLAAHNLAEERPSAAALWFFHTHPPVDQRIEVAREFESQAS